MKKRALANLTLMFPLFLFAVACTSEVRFVRKVRAPERGGTVAYSGYAEDEAREAMKDYCGKRGYVILEESEGVVPTGPIASSNLGVATGRVIGNDETYVTFKCRPKVSDY